MLAILLNQNPNRDDEEGCDNRVHGPLHRGPNQNRQQDYNEDEEYAEKVLGNQCGPMRDNDQDYQEQRDYQMKSIWIGLVRWRSFSIIWVLQMTNKCVWWLTN